MIFRTTSSTTVLYGVVGWSDPNNAAYDPILADVYGDLRARLPHVQYYTTTTATEPDVFVNKCDTEQLLNYHEWHLDGTGGPGKFTMVLVFERLEGDPTEYFGAVIKFYTRGRTSFEKYPERFQHGGKGPQQGDVDSMIARDNSAYAFAGGLVAHKVTPFMWKPSTGWRKRVRGFLRAFRQGIAVGDTVRAHFNHQSWHLVRVVGREPDDKLRVAIVRRSGGSSEWVLAIDNVFPPRDVVADSPAEPHRGTRYSIVFHVDVEEDKQAELAKELEGVRWKWVTRGLPRVCILSKK